MQLGVGVKWRWLSCVVVDGASTSVREVWKVGEVVVDGTAGTTSGRMGLAVVVERFAGRVPGL